MRPTLLTLFLLTSCIHAKEPSTKRGDKLLWSYFKDQVKRIADNDLADIKTKAQWEKKRPELRRQFFEMVGLWPLPKKTDLKVTITGRVETEHFTIEKLHYQSIPGLYVTGNLYVPKKLKGKAPAIIYVCGHGSKKINNVQYGNKVVYQHHPAWFAENGYVCLIVDTLQLGEVAGLHHGTYRHNMWWWQCRGYSPAGIECWNAIRGLDYLCSRKEVDTKRIGVTGRSGGGATSWWLAAADDRPQCIIPVAGIADLRAHVLEGKTKRLKRGVIRGHCDCMFFVNTYEWDFAKILALCAPRPLMLGNSDKDSIFPVPGYRRLADKARKIYKLYDAEEKFTLLETKGPHKDTPELQRGAFRWMNRWLKNDTSKITLPKKDRFTPQQLKVFERLPGDSINAIVHQKFVRPAKPPVPNAKDWPSTKNDWMRQLKEKVFRGWADDAPDLNIEKFAEVQYSGVLMRGFRFQSEAKVNLDLWLMTAVNAKPKLVVLTAVDEQGWNEWSQNMIPQFQKALLLPGKPKTKKARWEQFRRMLVKNQWAFATFAPRGIGPTKWSTTDEDGRSVKEHLHRRFALLGETLDGQRVWDVRRAVQTLQTVKDIKEAPLWLQGKGTMAGICLYASLFEPKVTRLDLWNPPASHHQGPIFLNIRRFFDMPQAMAMAEDKQVKLYVSDEKEAKAWAWTQQLLSQLGKKSFQIRQVPK